MKRAKRHIVRSAVVAVGIFVTAAHVQAQRSQSFDFLSLRGPNPQSIYEDIVIEQKLDTQVPLDLAFLDETGATVRLGDFLGDRPVILSLGYYRCPMTCDAQLNAVAIIIDALKFQIGKDYDVVAVSIDPSDTPETAAAKKENYLATLRRDGGGSGWHFLTTPDEDTIDTLADTVGYRYLYDPVSDQFAHASGIMVLTPTGRIARYYYGLEYITRDVELGLVDASQGKIGSVVDRLTLLCFRYDPTHGTYSLLIFRVVQFGAVLTVLAICLMYAVLYWRWRRRGDADDAAPTDPSVSAGSETPA